MNYRHAFHAGGFSDVVKHSVLALLLEKLAAKDKPFVVIDTHAGVGRYDLLADPAQRTGEFRDGILRLIERPPATLPPELAPYLRIVRDMNANEGQFGTALRWYPGSPALAQALLRPEDRLVLLELHPEDARALADGFAGDRRVSVRQGDGFTALKALLPPKERRGLVLVDPPYEAKDELDRVLRGLKHAVKRWATGVYALWYPIKGRSPIDAFHAALKASGIPRILAVELLLWPVQTEDRFNGCGLVIVNPPWQVDSALRAMMPRLAEILCTATGGARVEWLVPEE